METLVSLLIGVSLSAAAGFRLLVPFLVLSVAALFGHLPLAENLQWLDTYPALEGLGVAVVIETLMYYIPWLDHLLDVIALPTAMVAGTLITAAFGSDLNLQPFWQWSLAIIAGGGAAGAMKGLSGLTRFFSTATTGGLANFIVTTLELLGSLLLSVLAVAVPSFAVILLGVLLVIVIVLAGKRWWQKQSKAAAQVSTDASLPDQP